jgi:hypothetical protein
MATLGTDAFDSRGQRSVVTSEEMPTREIAKRAVPERRVVISHSGLPACLW